MFINFKKRKYIKFLKLKEKMALEQTNKDENVHRFAFIGELREGKRKRETVPNNKYNLNQYTPLSEVKRAN